MITLTKEKLRKLLAYNKETGVFTWEKRHLDKEITNKRGVNVFNALYAGKEAGNISYTARSKTPYLHIQILQKTYKAHRLAFLYVDGCIPEEVDHIDHNGLNNKWLNLRASNNKDNSKNLPKQKSNKTGVIGVNWHKSAKKWQARAVNHDGIRVDLGRYDKFEDAVKARKEHEIKFGYYGNRGDL